MSAPALAPEVSGKIYDCEPNAVDETQLHIAFNTPEEAELYILKKDRSGVIWPIGLDGKYLICIEWKGPPGY